MPTWLLLAAVAAAPKIAVVDLEATGVSKELSDGVGLLLPSEIRRLRPGASVISGSEIRAMLGFERQKALLACTEASCTAELGAALGVDEMVSGHVARVGASWVLELRRSDVNHPRVLGSTTRTVSSEDALLDGVRSAAAELYGSPFPSPTARPVGGFLLIGAGAVMLTAAIGGIAYGTSTAQSAATPYTVDRGTFRTARTIYDVSWAVAIAGAGVAAFGAYRVLAAPTPTGAAVVVGGRF